MVASQADGEGLANDASCGACFVAGSIAPSSMPSGRPSWYSIVTPPGSHGQGSCCRRLSARFGSGPSASMSYDLPASSRTPDDCQPRSAAIVDVCGRLGKRLAAAEVDRHALEVVAVIERGDVGLPLGVAGRPNRPRYSRRKSSLKFGSQRRACRACGSGRDSADANRETSPRPSTRRTRRCRVARGCRSSSRRRAASACWSAIAS